MVSKGPSVCLITPFPPKEDGVAEYSKYLSEALYEEGVSTSVITQKKPVQIVTQEFSLFDSKTEVFEVWNPNSILNQFSVFKRILRIKPDVVHAQYGPYSGYGGVLGEPLFLLFLLLRLARFPCAVTLHSIWFPQEAESRAYERTKNRLISKAASIYYYFFIKCFLMLFSSILVCVNFNSSPIVKQIVEVFNLAPSKVQQIVHGSISRTYLPQKFEVKNSLNLNGALLLCTGFIRQDKGYEYAINALSLLRKNGLQIKLVIVGKPNNAEGQRYLSLIKKQVKDLGLQDAVIFDIKYASEKDLMSYLASSDILLLPYSRRVGPSGPLALATSFGLPVIMTIDGKFTLHNIEPFVRLVPPRDPIALAATIKEVITDEQAIQKMAYEALSFSSSHSFNQIARQHISLYLHLTKR